MKRNCKGICLLACIVLLLPSASAYFRLPSPWGYSCHEGTCVKEENDGTSGLVSLNQCKLTCDQYGVMWPRPMTATLGKDVSHFLIENLAINSLTSPAEVEDLVREAFDIFKNNLQQYHPDAVKGSTPNWTGPWAPKVLAHSLSLDITIAHGDLHLTLDTDESYSLHITTGGESTTAAIIAQTFFGARHAMETLSHLIEYEEATDSLMVVNTATVTDSPKFKYRGLILDTSRNYISVSAIERTLDAMAANKLNTFHWHITDSHSFPLILETLPNMAYYGAYSSRHTYTATDIRHLVEYGRVRGIRILPEFDAPAHVGNGWQWAEKQVNLGKLAVCVNQEPWQSYCVEPPCGQLNLANPNMYTVLGQIYDEMVQHFSPIDLFHFGGDEVNLNCWNTSQEMITWMDDNGFGRDADAYYKQWSEFQKKARDLLVTANGGEAVPGILWTSHLTEHGRADQYLNKDEYIIQIWTEEDDPLIKELLDLGFRVIFSNYDYWYLDCGFGAWVGEGNNWCTPYKGWQRVYDNSPTKISIAMTGLPHEDLIMGGEAALWTEQADDAALDSRLWPRGAGLAERLWTDPDTNWEPALTRMIHHRQRLVARGIQADRLQPQWCHQNEDLCYVV